MFLKPNIPSFARVYRIFHAVPRRMTSSIPLPNRAIHFIVDWDGTLTKRDTLGTLVNIAKEAKTDTQILEAWNHCVQAYVLDYETLLKQHSPDGKLPITILEERKLLKALEVAEQKSIERVSQSGIFKGLTAEDIEHGARKAVENGTVQIREGYESFLAHIISRLSRQDYDIDALNIISVNWSERFIISCLEVVHSELKKALPDVKEKRKEQHSLERSWKLERQLRNRETGTIITAKKPGFLGIYANELEGIYENQPSTGVIGSKGTHKIVSSEDKVSYLQLLRKRSPYTMKAIPVVYIGDSWTDFECLLAADVGICIRDDPMTPSQKKLEDSINRLGIKLPHVSEYREVDEWNLMWAKDFNEIKNWMEELEHKTSTYSDRGLV
ncbi:hypothetical protein CC78DRAFT_531786 [Lojkania enalia]|uniref:Haloacid dehalogenase-like hydrolase n=1 Tax=Lojkania enalia TaxID=147567 RepID=A0A9P4KBW2_9PLEO|nr:hypothetical protein CC78DRAFT_531786 [Didymosphaeria enalia]